MPTIFRLAWMLGLMTSLAACGVGATEERHAPRTLLDAGATQGDQDYSFRTADGLTLTAKLTMPLNARAPVPVVIFIGGSGPWDADYQSMAPDDAGSGTHRVQILPIEDLARRCAANGMAFIRFAKRGVDPGGAENAAWGTSQLHNLLADAAVLLAKVKADRRLDGSRIAFVGHSEGTAIATWLAGHDPHVKAFGFMGLMRRNLKEVMRDQLVGSRLDRIFALADTSPRDGYLDGREIRAAERRGGRFPGWPRADADRDRRLSKPEVDAFLGLSRSFETWLSQREAARPHQSVSQQNGVREMPAGWWREHFAHQTVGSAWKTIATPVLVLQGKADANTPYDREAVAFDAQLTQQRHSDHTLVGYDGLTHTFVDAKGKSHAGRVFATLVPWLKRHLR